MGFSIYRRGYHAMLLGSMARELGISLLGLSKRFCIIAQPSTSKERVIGSKKKAKPVF
jgi:hypothetical protein